ncbi:hypothetical protein B4110_2283 [Parageobacillus toebii]|uniref:Uncharacterized protein n=1 Tax=Parageobacillus toebii TaxID=153151 RepID=A0A150MTN2_9BACL|nr:hypothetical protein B4110_2283 [Parageobacillus toebii]
MAIAERKVSFHFNETFSDQKSFMTASHIQRLVLFGYNVLCRFHQVKIRVTFFHYCTYI